MTDYKTLYDAIVNLNIPIEKQGKFANDKDLWFEYAHFPYIGKGNQSDAADLNIPLTFEAKTDGTVIRFCSYYTEEVQREIEVSFDDGDTWLPFKSYPSDNNQSIIAVLDTGKKILVRGDNPAMGYYSEEESAVVEGSGFWIDGEVYVYGNVMSLLDSTDFASMTSVPEYAFANLFCNSPLDGSWDNNGSLFSHPTKKLLLPATTLAKYCYSQMFQRCTSLTTAPELPAITLIYVCYDSMFSGCARLNYIKALFTTTPSNTYTKDWVKGVSSTGTFVKNNAASWNVTGDNGIPTGWTVETAENN